MTKQEQQQVVTLQIGKKANYIGSHLCNLRHAALVSRIITNYTDDYDKHNNDVFFHRHPLDVVSDRVGDIADAWVPRVRIFDDAHNFGALCVDDCRFHSDLFPSTGSSTNSDAFTSSSTSAAESAHTQTQAQAQTFRHDVIPPHHLSMPDSAPPQLAATSPHTLRSGPVSYWSDFLCTPLRPGCCTALSPGGVRSANENAAASGDEPQKGRYGMDDLFDDTVRRDIERVDALSAIVLVADTTQPHYRSLSTALVDYCADAIGTRVPKLLFCVGDGHAGSSSKNDNDKSNNSRATSTVDYTRTATARQQQLQKQRQQQHMLEVMATCFEYEVDVCPVYIYSTGKTKQTAYHDSMVDDGDDGEHLFQSSLDCARSLQLALSPLTNNASGSSTSSAAFSREPASINANNSNLAQLLAALRPRPSILLHSLVAMHQQSPSQLSSSNQEQQQLTNFSLTGEQNQLQSQQPRTISDMHLLHTAAQLYDTRYHALSYYEHNTQANTVVGFNTRPQHHTPVHSLFRYPFSLYAIPREGHLDDLFTSSPSASTPVVLPRSLAYLRRVAQPPSARCWRSSSPSLAGFVNHRGDTIHNLQAAIASLSVSSGPSSRPGHISVEREQLREQLMSMIDDYDA